MLGSFSCRAVGLCERAPVCARAEEWMIMTPLGARAKGRQEGGGGRRRRRNLKEPEEMEGNQNWFFSDEAPNGRIQRQRLARTFSSHTENWKKERKMSQFIGWSLSLSLHPWDLFSSYLSPLLSFLFFTMIIKENSCIWRENFSRSLRLFIFRLLSHQTRQQGPSNAS